jgi:hypothetical protein
MIFRSRSLFLGRVAARQQSCPVFRFEKGWTSSLGFDDDLRIIAGYSVKGKLLFYQINPPSWPGFDPAIHESAI